MMNLPFGSFDLTKFTNFLSILKSIKIPISMILSRSSSEQSVTDDLLPKNQNYHQIEK